MTYLEIAQAIRAQAGIAGAGPSAVVNQTGIYKDCIRWVDEGYNEIQTMHENWNFLHNTYSFTLQAGLTSYNPSDLVGSNGAEGVRTPTKDTFTIHDASLVVKERLRYIPWSVWQRSNDIIKGKVGKPVYYTEDPSGQYRFYPMEEAQADSLDNIDWEIEFNGFSRPHVLVSSTDSPVFPSQYHELIKLKGLMRYGEYYNALDVYKTASLAFDSGVKQLEYSELPRENLATIPLVVFA